MTVFDVVLVTGANGGLGTHFVEQALERGARTVYATARTPREWDDPRIVPLTLDVTDPASVAAAAAAAADVTLVVNNAGSSNGATVLNDNPALRDLFDVNLFGPLAVAGAFAPALATNGGGALLNVLSVLSWIGIGAKAPATASGPKRFTSNRSRRAGLSFRTVAPFELPALLTTSVTSAAAAAAAATDAGSVTSSVRGTMRGSSHSRGVRAVA